MLTMTILIDNIIITVLLLSAVIVSSYKFLCLGTHVDVCSAATECG